SPAAPARGCAGTCLTGSRRDRRGPRQRIPPGLEGTAECDREEQAGRSAAQGAGGGPAVPTQQGCRSRAFARTRRGGAARSVASTRPCWKIGTIAALIERACVRSHFVLLTDKLLAVAGLP